MRTEILYICDICNSSWTNEESCKICESIGYPENYNKLIGKWIIVPVLVSFKEEETRPQKAPFDNYRLSYNHVWRVVRIDSNSIKNLTGSLPIGATEKYMEQLKKLHHKLIVQCRGFEDGTRVESLAQAIYIPEDRFEHLNILLVKLEVEREIAEKEFKSNVGEYMTPYLSKFLTSPEFEERQHAIAEQALNQIVKEMNIELPVIEKQNLQDITFASI